MKRKLITVGILMLISMSALADQVCVGLNTEGSCSGWVNTIDGSYTSSAQGIISISNNSSLACACAAYDANYNCTDYIGCQPVEMSLTNVDTLTFIAGFGNCYSAPNCQGVVVMENVSQDYCYSYGRSWYSYTMNLCY